MGHPRKQRKPVEAARRSRFVWIWKNYLTYNASIGEAHDLIAMVGMEAQKSAWEGTQVTKKNFASNDINVLSEGRR